MAKYEIITKRDFTPNEIAKYIDHSLLFAYSSKDDVIKFCNDIKEYGFIVGYVNSVFVDLAVKEFKGHNISVGSSIAFPWGTVPTELKVAEIEYVLKKGAKNVDFVVHIGAIKAADWDTVHYDIGSCVKAAKKFGAAECKVVLENCYLTDEEKVKAALIAKEEGVDYLKTSTGFGSGVWTVPDVRLLKKTVGTDVGIKAAGSVPDYDSAVMLLNAGASRLGTRFGIEILKTAPGWK
ncbi:MAG: deoxyribose-phosphate aldolase [Eubacteriales bacterium]